VAPFLLVFSAYAQPSTASRHRPWRSFRPGRSPSTWWRTNKKGAPIRDLKPTDFEITSSGSPVRIDDLHLVRRWAGTRPCAPGDPGVRPRRARIRAQSAGCGRGASQGGPSDGQSCSPFSGWTGVSPATEFTADREALTKAIDLATSTTTGLRRAGETTGGGVEGGRPSSRTRIWRRCCWHAPGLQDIVRDPHTPPAIASLMAACRQQAGLPGRKTLVYFSAGLDWTTQDPEMPTKVAEVASEAV